MKSSGDMSMGLKMYKQGELSPVDTADNDGSEMMGDKASILGSQAESYEPTMMKKGANPANEWDKISKMAGNKDLYYNF